jgi:hypothetical protein
VKGYPFTLGKGETVEMLRSKSEEKRSKSLEYSMMMAPNNNLTLQKEKILEL